MQILIVDDDNRLAAALSRALERRGITTRHVTLGRSALAAMHSAEFILLDLSLPDIDGISVCRELRAKSDLPIIILTGRSDVDQRVIGLRSGADDYVVKPFNVTELIARIYAVRRRRGPTRCLEPLRINDVTIDFVRRTVTVAGAAVALSRKEFQVLALLAHEEGVVCSREQLVNEVWGRPWNGAENTLNVHIATLRSKIGRPEIVETVRGVGYRLSSPVKAG